MIFSLLFFCTASDVFAIAKFNTTYQIYYNVTETGKTHVKFVINQKNNLSVVYATDFGLSINETKLENIKVLDEGTPVKADVIKSLNQTSITFPFSSKVVGKDKLHTFTIEYDTPDITTKSGNTWQIDIPRLDQDENVTAQTVILTVPTGFSVPAYIDPKPDVVNGNIYYFSGNKISNKSISAVFGKTQYYRGKLDYHLTNNDSSKTRMEIALPPDTSYQTVLIKSINPPPININFDNDGNLLASYDLLSKEKKDISVEIIFRLDFLPKPSKSQPPDSLLSKSSIWNFDHSVFSSPELSSLKTPKSIYDFVSDKLKYDYEKLNRERPGRVPAAESLINYRSAICTDFTDVFVSLARKAGIHSRELQGFAITQNPDLKPLSLTQDVLHAWPEYFDKAKSTWIQVDPTWANTTRGIDYFNKLDFNHIVFVIHGENSEYPLTAGAYKNGLKTKDISIEPTEIVDFPAPKFTLQFVKQEGENVLIEIKNLGGSSFYGSLRSDETSYLEKLETWVSVPPLFTKTISLKVRNTPYFGNINSRAIIYLNGARYDTGVSIGSASNQALLLSGIGGFLAVVAFWARHLHLRRQKQKTSLYR